MITVLQLMVCKIKNVEIPESVRRRRQEEIKELMRPGHPSHHPPLMQFVAEVGYRYWVS